MRDQDILSYHQRSAREKAKDPVTLCVFLSRTDIVCSMDAHSLSLSNVGDAVRYGDS